MSESWRGRRATVMGLGLFGGGAAAARWLVRQGARVTVTDLRGEEELAPGLRELADLPLRWVLGRHDEEDLLGADVVVVNPAVPPTSPLLARAREAGVRVTSEMELVLERLPERPLLVTGTHGKSSTVHFTAQLLRAAGRAAVAGGNIGEPLLGRLDELVGVVPVVEVSSYQLEVLPPGVGRARAAAITPVVADHLERHGTLAAYRAVKASLIEQVEPGGPVLAGSELLALSARTDVRRVEAPSSVPGRGLEWDGEEVRLDGETLARLDGFPLVGQFQRENAARAVALAHWAGLGRRELESGLAGLEGLPHRLQDLGLHGGLRVIDNGVSTTPESTLSAVEALPGLGPGDVLLVGGRAKRGVDLASLARAAAARGFASVAFGGDGPALAAAFEEAGAPVERVPDLPAAVARAFELGRPGGTLLFSPACASFDAYSNFRARALHLRRLLGASEAGVGPDAG